MLAYFSLFRLLCREFMHFFGEIYTGGGLPKLSNISYAQALLLGAIVLIGMKYEL